jgi:DNA modification methylase
MSNIKNYKYDIIWDKVSTSSGVLSKKRPLNAHELISIFYSKQPTYNPQMQKGKKWSRGGKMKKSAEVYGEVKDIGKPENDTTDMKYPKQISTFSNANRNNRVHPTQKPVALMEYLIKTYTNENELVLDFTMGSGTTGVACKNLNRDFIGIEMDNNYFNIAKERING